jgi:hypothetical protein
MLAALLETLDPETKLFSVAPDFVLLLARHGVTT